MVDFRLKGAGGTATAKRFRTSKNTTKLSKFLIRRWYHHRGKITDIIKTGCQVKKILN